MNRELRKPDAGRYTNADHVEFHETSYIIFDRNSGVINIPGLLADYQAKITQEARIYKWLRRSRCSACCLPVRANTQVRPYRFKINLP